VTRWWVRELERDLGEAVREAVTVEEPFTLPGGGGRQLKQMVVQGMVEGYLGGGERLSRASPHGCSVRECGEGGLCLHG
jgi:hypothetical protein